jgi:hypothetical protein
MRRHRLSATDSKPRRPDGRSPLAAGLILGLGAGLLAALLDGLPLLLQGSPWPHLGSRLLALAYLAAIYGLLGTLLGLLLGLILLALRTVRRKRPLDQATAAGPLRTALPSAGQAAGPVSIPWRAWRAVVMALFLAAAGAVAGAALFRGVLRDKPLFDPPVTGESASAERPNIVLITADGITWVSTITTRPSAPTWTRWPNAASTLSRPSRRPRGPSRRWPRCSRRSTPPSSASTAGLAAAATWRWTPSG